LLCPYKCLSSIYDYSQEELAKKYSNIKTPRFKIPNYKHQITNKSQIPILNVQNVLNFGHWDLFDIWDLGFGIWVLLYNSFTPTPTLYSI
jgi:hypothetical protein